MKKRIAFALIIAAVALFSISIAACAQKGHVHIFDKKVATQNYLKAEATCTEKAQYYYSCECGEKGTETFAMGEALGHEYSEVVYNWMNNVCTAKRICTRTGCDHSEEENATITSTVTQQQSCEKDELTTYTATFNNSEFTTQTDVVKTKDSFGGHTYSTEWTYSETEHWHECSRCHDKKDKAEHSFVNNICTVCSYAPYEAFAFTLNKDGNGYTLTKYSGTKQNVIIPSVYDGKPVSAIGNYAFAHCTELTSITIGNSVTSIGDVAFYGCTGLETITVNKGNTKYHIKDNCLIETESKTLVLGCKNSIIPIDGSVTSIGNYAFSYCEGLTSITIPNGVTSIGDSAFSYCEGLTSITVGNSITSIGYDAFRGCMGLTSITIPNSVTSIGDAAFYGCCRLIEVYNKSSLSITAGSENNGCVACYAKNVYKDEGGSKLSTDEKGYLIYTDEEEKILVAYTGKESTLTLPSDITQINQCAFSGCSGLTSVTIGNGVTSIGSGAFEYCSGLTSITIPNSVTSIGDSAFYGCSGLTSVTIPDSVTSIGYSAFSGCYKLVEVINKSGLNITKGSSDNGYIACYALNVKKDGTSDIVNKDGYLFYTYDNVNYLFAYVGSNTDLTLPDDYNGQNYKLNNYAFYNCSGLTSVTIPDSVTSIGDEAFEYCSGLTSVTIGNSVTSIGDGAFICCSGLTSVTIGNSVTSIGELAFSGCSGLTSVTIGNSVTSIGDAVFYYCSGLTSVIWNAENCTSAGSSPYPIFSDCLKLANVTIGENVKIIPDYAFYNCSGLTVYYTGDVAGWCGIEGLYNVTPSSLALYIGDKKVEGDLVIPDSVTSIGSSAFYGCSSLTSVTIGNSVTSIGYSAFYNCSGLTSVTIGDSVTSIGSSAFYGCSSLTSVTIGNSVTSIGYSAFYNCSGLKNITYTGTSADWKNIAKVRSWNEKVPSTCIIHCTDGDIKISD